MERHLCILLVLPDIQRRLSLTAELEAFDSEVIAVATDAEAVNVLKWCVITHAILPAPLLNASPKFKTMIAASSVPVLVLGAYNMADSNLKNWSVGDGSMQQLAEFLKN